MMEIIEALKMKRQSILLRVQILLIVLILQAAIHSSYAAAQTTPPPTVSITAPKDGTTLRGIVTVTVQASSPDGILSVALSYIQGTYPQDIPPAKAQGPYTWNWDTSAVDNGTYKLQAQAFDNNGVSNTAEINVTIANGPAGAPALTPGSIGLLSIVVVALAAVGVMVLYRKRSRSSLKLPNASATQYLTL